MALVVMIRRTASGKAKKGMTWMASLKPAMMLL